MAVWATAAIAHPSQLSTTAPSDDTCPPAFYVTLLYGKSRSCGATNLLQAADRAISISLVPNTTSSRCISTTFDLAANSFVIITNGDVPDGCVLEGYPQAGCLGDSVQINVLNNVGSCKTVAKGKSFRLFC